MSSREAFEKYVEEGEYLALDRDPSGEYRDRETQSAWAAWKAATERAAEIAYDHLDDPFLSGHGYATGVSEAVREGND
jgi:hypothetical protein